MRNSSALCATMADKTPWNGGESHRPVNTAARQWLKTSGADVRPYCGSDGEEVEPLTAGKDQHTIAWVLGDERG